MVIFYQFAKSYYKVRRNFNRFSSGVVFFSRFYCLNLFLSSVRELIVSYVNNFYIFLFITNGKDNASIAN